jgi:hypothetical protein
MRFIILVKAKKSSEAGVLPDEELLTAQVEYHEEFAFEDPTVAELKGLSGMYHLSAVRWQD